MHIALELVRLALLFLSLSAIWFYLSSIYGARDLFKESARPISDFHPPVSILKPIRGLDCFAYENLSSFCKQSYTNFQVVFGALDPDDPGLATARKIARDFKNIDVRLVSGGPVIGTNLKVSNLAYMAKQAGFAILVLADSDIRVGPDYLERIIRPFEDPKVGLVTCLYRARPRGLLSMLEALGTTTEFHAGVLVARKLQGMKFAFGSTIAIRREVLENIGGFQTIADYLADDFLLGSFAADAGYRVVLSDYVVEHVLDRVTLLGFVKHQTRWGRTTRVSRPKGYAGLIFTQGVAASLLFLLASRGSPLGWAVLAVTWGIRTLAGLIVGAAYLKDRTVARFFWLIPLRDLIGFVLWIYTFLGSRVEWRGQPFRLTRGGKLIPLARETDS